MWPSLLLSVSVALNRTTAFNRTEFNRTDSVRVVIESVSALSDEALIQLVDFTKQIRALDEIKRKAEEIAATATPVTEGGMHELRESVEHAQDALERATDRAEDEFQDDLEAMHDRAEKAVDRAEKAFEKSKKDTVAEQEISITNAQADHEAELATDEAQTPTSIPITAKEAQMKFDEDANHEAEAVADMQTDALHAVLFARSGATRDELPVESPSTLTAARTGGLLAQVELHAWPLGLAVSLVIVASFAVSAVLRRRWKPLAERNGYVGAASASLTEEEDARLAEADGLRTAMLAI